MGELGRTPLHIQIICSVLKFLQRLKDLDDGHLLRQALFTSIEVHKHNMSSWYTSILYILKCLNIDVENFDIDTVKDALIKRYICLIGNIVSMTMQMLKMENCVVISNLRIFLRGNHIYVKLKVFNTGKT